MSLIGMEVDVVEGCHLLKSEIPKVTFRILFYGEAFVIDDSGQFLAVLNIRNHLQLQLTDCNGALENTWNRLVGMETSLGKSLNFAFTPQFGFLTADPSTCGTGLIVNIFLQVPALIHSGHLATAISKNTREGVAFTGLQGDPDNLVGDIVVLHNTFSLGLSEENIVSAIRTSLTKLMVEEKGMRAKIRTDGDSEIKDHVSRAYGLLLHSYQIETIEALNSISLLKLGVDLDWLEGTTLQALNNLFFSCRRAHLVSEKEKEDAEAVLHKRSELIHKTLKDANLNI